MNIPSDKKIGLSLQENIVDLVELLEKLFGVMFWNSHSNFDS
jgi:hypothetical protein